MQESELVHDDPRDLEKVIRALTSPVRREILTLIWERDLAAGEIAAAFTLTKPTISQHLSVLRQAGLVDVAVAGTSRRYRARQEVLSGLKAALGDSEKWTSADDLPERELADSRTASLVEASVEVDSDQAATFRAFTDPELYSRWLGVPVTIADGRFSCTMEFGTEIRGRYEVVCPPALLAVRWDFAHGNVPLPGDELVGYIRFEPAGTGSSVTVHQIVHGTEQAQFMASAWTMVLGRLKEGVVAALRPDSPGTRRAPRPRRSARS